MPNYSKSGKILVPLTEEQFIQGMDEGRFCKDKHRGFAALLYYTGIRVSEALRSNKEQYSLQNRRIYFDVLKRLKHGLVTPPLAIPISKPFAESIWEAVEETKPKQRVFPYSRMTGYNIITRLWRYPHHLRLTRITDLFRPHPEIGRPEGFSIAEVKTYTGLTLPALDFYIGLVSIEKMGEA